MKTTDTPVSGQKPRLTKDGKSIICKTDNFVPLVVPGLSTIPESRASSASLSQDSLRKEAEQAPRELVQPASSSSSSSVSERSDELASRRLVPFPKIQNQNKMRSDRKNSDDPLADLPEWLESSKKISKIQHCMHPHTVSELRFRTFYESGNKIKETQHLHSLPKRPRLRRVLENQNNKGSLQKTHWRRSTSRRKVW